MRVQDHIGLISWSLIDKALYVLYGLVLIVIMNYTEPAEFGLFSLLIGLHTWIFTVSDSFSLQSLIQFGMKEENRAKINLISFVTHLAITIGASMMIFFLRHPLADLFNEPRIVEIAVALPLLSLAFIPKTYCQKIIYRIQNMFFLFLSNLAFFGVISAFILYRIALHDRLTFSDLALYYLLGSIAGSLVAYALTAKHIKFSRIGSISIRKVFEFSWKMTSVSLLFTFPRQLDIFIIKIFFSLEIIGLYAAAKNIFRVFDEILGALNSILYPKSVKLVNERDYTEFESLVSKSYSFLFVIFTFFFFTLVFGIDKLMFTIILPDSFQPSLYYFRILILTLPILPFTLLYTYLVALDKMGQIIIISGIGLIVFFISILLIGLNNLHDYIPAGLSIYYFFLGLTSIIMSRKYLNYSFNNIFRAIYDIKNFLKAKK